MPNWILKSAVQRIISWLPQSHRWNALLQKHGSKGYYASQATFEGKLRLCQKHLDHYLKFSKKPAHEFSALEIGTGSWPIVPIGLYLCGARGVWTYDIVPLLEAGTLRHTLAQFATAIEDGSLQIFLHHARQDRIADLLKLMNDSTETPSALLKRLKIHVRVSDARQTALPLHSIDLIFSTVVFEHIPAAIITGLLAEFRRVLAPEGVMSHYIGLADQYASVDRSITPFNHLQYTSAQWRWLNNPITSQTRLRIPDYRALFQQGGFALVREENLLGKAEELCSLALAPEFRHHSFEDLLVLFSWLIAKPASSVLDNADENLHPDDVRGSHSVSEQ